MCFIFGKDRPEPLKENMSLKSSTLQFGLSHLFSKKNKIEKVEKMPKHHINEFDLYQKLINNVKEHIAMFEQEKMLDEFLLNGLELLFLIIKLDIFSLIDPTKEDYHKIVRSLVFMIEFDSENSKLSQLLIETRKKKEIKAGSMLNDNYLKSFHKSFFKIINIKSGVMTMFQNVGELVGLAGDKKSKTSSKIALTTQLDDKQLEQLMPVLSMVSGLQLSYTSCEHLVAELTFCFI